MEAFDAATTVQKDWAESLSYGDEQAPLYLESSYGDRGQHQLSHSQCCDQMNAVGSHSSGLPARQITPATDGLGVSRKDFSCIIPGRA